MQIQLRADLSSENQKCTSNLSAHEALISAYFTGQMTTTRHSVHDVTQQKSANEKLVIYRVIQSLHTWGMWSLYLQNLLYRCTITLVEQTDASLPLKANSLEHIWCYARTCISNVFF